MAINKRLIKSNDEGGSASFNTVVYSGNGTSQSIDTVGFAPDLVWVKNRLTTNYHILSDTVRGANKQLYSNTTDSEQPDAGFITGFNIDGFDVGNSPSTNTSGSDNMVAWNWKAGGAAVTNTDGTITSQVSANTEAGFSIVTFTSPNGASNTSYTVGHGLGITPNVVICKSRNTTGGWYTYHSSGTSNNQFIRLDTTGAVATAGSAVWGAGMTNNVIGVTLDQSIDQNDTNVAYCFAEVAGFSKFGSYTGNGSTNFITTGFEPAFIMMKSSSTATGGYWVIMDNKRSPSNPRDNELFPNDSVEEYEGNRNINFLSNGFELTSSSYNNENGTTYIYMAFANQF